MLCHTKKGMDDIVVEYFAEMFESTSSELQVKR